MPESSQCALTDALNHRSGCSGAYMATCRTPETAAMPPRRPARKAAAAAAGARRSCACPPSGPRPLCRPPCSVQVVGSSQCHLRLRPFLSERTQLSSPGTCRILAAFWGCDACMELQDRRGVPHAGRGRGGQAARPDAGGGGRGGGVSAAAAAGREPAAASFLSANGAPLQNEYDPARPNDYAAIRRKREEVCVPAGSLV